ncbi:DNA sulfur modification protein DndB [Streptomyces sp. NPDC085927]|uniref:DNA sulfur modification protein DndB n=1 Tax=Streptomyces sp. NPDC085927 TaxID=3365738 RepID=UPI0037CDA5B2
MSDSEQMFGYTPYPAIWYRMGNREMAVTAMTPVAYNSVVGPREAWDPLSGTGTNRKEDKNHRRAIAQYVADTPDYVLNSLLVYVGAQDAKFVPDRSLPADAPIKPGVLYLRPGATLKVGDGGHRTDAYGDVISAHKPLNDEVFQRLSTSGQPIVVVLDDDQFRRAQDFTDLQRNAKPLNASIGQSMDRRQSINRILIEDVIKRDDIPIFGVGRKVEFLSDTPGKLSAKTMGYKTLRYASGTLLIGTSVRDARGWDASVELEIASDEARAITSIVDFWKGFSQLPDFVSALSAPARGIELLRSKTWLLSANLIYAAAAATHAVTSEEIPECDIPTAMKALQSFDFSRGESTPLIGTLVDPDTGKSVTGRTAWEGATATLVAHIRDELASTP